MKAWMVPRNPSTPEGFKYSLVYIDPSGKRVLGYDNSKGKGHHRHEGRIEEAVAFTSIEALVGRFHQEVERLREPHES